MTNQNTYDQPVCEICGDHENASVVCAMKSTYSEPVYIEEAYYCLCSQCLSNLYID